MLKQKNFILWKRYLPLFFLCAIFNVNGEIIIPGENLVLDGIPSLDSGIIEVTKPYTEFRPSSFGAWHPLKREMLILHRAENQETAQVQLLERPLAEKISLTHSVEKIADVSYEPKKGNYFLFRRDVGGGEWYQIYRYDLKNNQEVLLTDGKRSRNSSVLWSNKGDLIAYTSTKRNGKDGDFYIMDPLNPSSEKRVAELNNGDAWFISDWSPKDDRLVAIKQLSITDGELWIFDLKTGSKKQILKQTATPQEEVSFQDAKFSKDGKSLYVITDENSEFLRLVKIDLKTNQRTVLNQNKSWDVDEMALSPFGDEIAYVTNEAGASVLHLLRFTFLGQVKDEIIKDLPVGVISALSWHPRSGLLAFNLNSARSPSDVKVLNVYNKRISSWTQTKAPRDKMDLNSFVEPLIIKWPSFDGREISGFFYKPDALKFPGKRPVIVNIHGGPESQSRPLFQGRLNYYLNELGIAVIFPNIRGSAGYGKTFLTLDNWYKREDSYKDIESLLDWIKNQNNLDGEKILVTGGSYGGHTTLAVATRYADKIAAAIDVVGMSNLVTFLEKTEEYRRDLRRVEYGDERIPEMRAFLERIAPLNNASNVKKPLFIVQGANDPRVPYEEAEQMLEAVKRNGTPVWYLKAMDEGHGFAKKKNADFQFYSTIEFIKRYLLK